MEKQKIISYASKSDYLARKPIKEAIGNPLLKGTELVGQNTSSPIDNVELSSRTKGLNSSEVKEKIEDKVRDIPEKLKAKLKEGQSAGGHLLNQAGTALFKGVKSFLIPSSPISSVNLQSHSSRTSAVNNRKEESVINKPGIFFIKGFSLNPFSSKDEGLGAMAKNIPSSKVFGWSDEEALLEEIEKRPRSQPIILVGHGMGGDTAVAVANRLNHADHGFRQINLLVTLDSIGTDNDIIPQNVKENYNLISDQDFLFNDGPNIARNKSLTRVDNQLLEKGHSEMEYDPEVQFLVYEKINQTLMNAISMRDLKTRLNHQLKNIHNFSNLNSSLSLIK